MKKKVTIYDIARELNITVSTVSRALNDSRSISTDTKDLVRAMAQKLNYSPNKLAASLKSGKTFTIGVIVPSTRVQFFASVIHSIELTLKAAGYGILLYQTNESLENEKQGVKTLLEAQVDGIIASLSLETSGDISHFETVIRQGKALVLFDRTMENFNVPSVTLNDFQAGYIAAEHLLKKNFTNITFIAPPQKISIFKQRVEGCLAALQSYGVPIHENTVRYRTLSIEGGKAEIQSILDSCPLPDAIIAGDDFTALGVLKQLKERGVAPGRVAVMGFANEVFSEFITPSLTTIEQQPHKMGAECARIFLEMVKKKNPYENPEKVVLEPILVERESTK
ncbi:MAG: LacI family transcriptional regulator [Leadbetterella sp.]|nr:LacI family transcriptional regulator [Leadbetterella sp.]